MDLKNTKLNNKKALKKKEKNSEKLLPSKKLNDYIKYSKDKKLIEENDQKIKLIEDEIKRKNIERLKRLELIEKSRAKELFKLEIKLLRKLYGDLFISFPNTFKENELNFENFIFEFSSKIHEIFELNKNNEHSSYDDLVKEVSKLILKKYPVYPDLTKFNKLELKKYFYDLGINDDWALIQKYKQEMDKIEEKERLKKIALNMKAYYNDLNEQIENKKMIIKNEEEKIKEKKEKKMKEEFEKIKNLNMKKIEKIKKNEKMMNFLDKKKIEKMNENEKLKKHYLEYLEEENDNLNANNMHLIKFKLDNIMSIQNKEMQNYIQKNNISDNNKNIINNIVNSGYDISDEQMSNMVDQIMNKKKESNFFYIIDKEKEKEKEENNNYNNIEGIDYEMEKKVNKILNEHRSKIKIKK